MIETDTSYTVQNKRIVKHNRGETMIKRSWNTFINKKFFYQVLFTVFSFSSTNVLCIEKYSLQEFDATKYIKIKTTMASIWKCKHIVYRDKNNKFFYKIWGLQENFGTPNYIKRCQDFLAAFDEGVFDEVAPLHALLFDNGLCCGYVTKACQPLNRSVVKWKTMSGLPKLLLVKEQPIQLIYLWEKFLKVYDKTKYLFCDCGQLANLGYLNGEYFLIDLDDFLRERDAAGVNLTSWIGPNLNNYRIFREIVSMYRIFRKIILQRDLAEETT